MPSKHYLLLPLMLCSILASAQPQITEYPLPEGSHPHDVAPAADGGVWYTAQHDAALGWLDPANGKTRHIPLGDGSRPHGVIVGADGAAWVTDSGLNAILRVDPADDTVRRFEPPPGTPYMNLNTATFDGHGVLWFTGQSGYYGRLLPGNERLEVFEAPRGRGPYGICATPGGDIYYASLAGDHIARIDTKTGQARIIEPPTPNQGARRVWSDSKGKIWVSEWDAGQLGRYDPADGSWREWPLPGRRPHAYAVYVDERDQVWLSDFSANAILRFDPVTEHFDSFPLLKRGAKVRQILGRMGEVWLPLSGVDQLAVIRTLHR